MRLRHDSTTFTFTDTVQPYSQSWWHSTISDMLPPLFGMLVFFDGATLLLLALCVWEVVLLDAVLGVIESVRVLLVEPAHGERKDAAHEAQAGGDAPAGSISRRSVLRPEERSVDGGEIGKHVDTESRRVNKEVHRMSLKLTRRTWLAKWRASRSDG